MSSGFRRIKKIKEELTELLDRHGIEIGFVCKDSDYQNTEEEQMCIIDANSGQILASCRGYSMGSDISDYENGGQY